jgi:hypothetical protein
VGWHRPPDPLAAVPDPLPPDPLFSEPLLPESAAACVADVPPAGADPVPAWMGEPEGAGMDEAPVLVGEQPATPSPAATTLSATAADVRNRMEGLQGS